LMIALSVTGSKEQAMTLARKALLVHPWPVADPGVD